MPLTTIADFHFIDGTDNGDDYRKLKIRTLRKEYTIDEQSAGRCGPVPATGGWHLTHYQRKRPHEQRHR
ncbi:hypothetical protein ACQZ6C_20535 [Rhizobium rhizogenes]